MLVFRKKDLYLVITEKLTVKSVALFTKSNTENQQKHRVTIPCKWSFEKWRFSRKAALFTNGLPSVLYETPGLNERSVLNQLFLMISGAFHMKSATFHEKHNAFHMKSTAFHFELLGDDQV